MRPDREAPAPDGRRRAAPVTIAAMRQGRRQVRGWRGLPETSAFWTAGEASAQQRTSCLLFRPAPYVAAAGQWIDERTQTSALCFATQHRSEAIRKKLWNCFAGFKR